MKVQRFRLLMTYKIVVEIGEIIMKISTKGRYALRMVIDLAEHADDGFISLKDIAARQGLSKKYLEQIVPLLNKTGMLSTTRGYQGGYKLAKSPSECTVGKILQTTEGSLAPEEILTDILGEFGLEILSKMPVQFHCDCERSRVEKAIISIGKKEIRDMIDEGKEIEVNCQFCNKHYKFSVDELGDLLKKATRE